MKTQAPELRAPSTVNLSGEAKRASRERHGFNVEIKPDETGEGFDSSTEEVSGFIHGGFQLMKA